MPQKGLAYTKCPGAYESLLTPTVALFPPHTVLRIGNAPLALSNGAVLRIEF